jgi:hypothetical protein
MKSFFERVLKRSSYGDAFLKNKPLPKKYYMFPLCNVAKDVNLTKKLKYWDLKRTYLTRTQVGELGYDIQNSFDAVVINSKEQKKIWNWAQRWCLKNPQLKIHNQKPGQMFPFHLDSTSKYIKLHSMNTVKLQKKIRRLFVFLEDYSPGQIVMVGNTIISDWKKGDVLWFDWYNVPHGTANFGRKNRPILQITGETTPAFEKLIKKSS